MFAREFGPSTGGLVKSGPSGTECGGVRPRSRAVPPGRGRHFPARPSADKTTAEVHDYHDELTGVLASSLAKRAPGYTSLGFPDPRKHPCTPGVSTAD
jgi:hypothetical protein